jgi:hypothetical protein
MHGVAVHISQFLDALIFREDVEPVGSPEQARAWTPALQPAGRPALHSNSCGHANDGKSCLKPDGSAGAPGFDFLS